MSWILSDYLCPRCGFFESLETRPAPGAIACSCGEVAARIITGVHAKTVWATPATRAKSDERPGPGTMDTRALADGADVAEWRAKRNAMWRDRARSDWKSKVG